MENSSKYRWSFACLSTAHLLLCSLVPSWPQIITKPHDPEIEDSWSIGSLKMFIDWSLEINSLSSGAVAGQHVPWTVWLVTELAEPNTPKPGLTSQTCYRRTGDDNYNLSLFFHSSNLLRHNLHSDTCTDLKRTVWELLIYVYTSVTSIQIKTKNISSTLENSFMPPLNQQLPV